MPTVRSPWLPLLTGVLAVAAGGLFPAVARADKLILVGGGELEGKVERTVTGAYRVSLPRGAVVEVPAADVIRVDTGETNRQWYEERRAILDPTDAAGHYELGLACLDRSLKAEAEACFEHVVKVAPDHEGARRALGHVLMDGRWLPQDEAFARQGQIRHGSRWVTPEEKERLLAGERRRKIERELSRIAGRLRSSVSETRAAARARVMELGLVEDARGPLLESTRHWTQEMRTIAALSLGALAKRGDEEVLAALTHMATRDADLEPMDAAIEVLKDVRSVKVGEWLLQDYLFARETHVRSAAAYALGEIRYRDAVEPFIATLYFKVVRDRLVLTDMPASIRLRARSPGGRYSVLRTPTLDGVGFARYEVRRVADFAFNAPAKEALKRITGRDFDYDHEAWWRFWERSAPSFGPFMEPLEKEKEADEQADGEAEDEDEGEGEGEDDRSARPGR